MSQELLYTSAPRGLKPGSRGFCTVLSTQGMAAPLATALEGLSGYRPLYPAGDDRAARNPVVYSHLKLQIGGRVSSVLSRIADFGLDYSQRANKLAHHVVLDKSELSSGDPASLLSMPGFMREKWEGEPKVVALKPVKPKTQPLIGVCRAWQELVGDAGWAGVLAESFLRDPERLVVLLFAPGQDILPLFIEAMSLLPTERRWDLTFSTYFTGLAPATTCVWRAMIHDSKEAHESLRFVNALRLDLTSGTLGPATGGALVEAARSGVRPSESQKRVASSAARAEEQFADLGTDEEFVELEDAHVEFAPYESPVGVSRPPELPQPPLRLPDHASSPPKKRRPLADLNEEEARRPSRFWLWMAITAGVLLMATSFGFAIATGRVDLTNFLPHRTEREQALNGPESSLERTEGAQGLSPVAPSFSHATVNKSNEEVAAGKVVADKAVADKAVADNAAADKAAADKAAADKAVADKAVADKAAADKAAADKAAADKAAANSVVSLPLKSEPIVLHSFPYPTSQSHAQMPPQPQVLLLKPSWLPFTQSKATQLQIQQKILQHICEKSTLGNETIASVTYNDSSLDRSRSYLLKSIIDDKAKWLGWCSIQIISAGENGVPINRISFTQFPLDSTRLDRDFKEGPKKDGPEVRWLLPKTAPVDSKWMPKLVLDRLVVSIQQQLFELELPERKAELKWSIKCTEFESAAYKAFKVAEFKPKIRIDVTTIEIGQGQAAIQMKVTGIKPFLHHIWDPLKQQQHDHKDHLFSACRQVDSQIEKTLAEHLKSVMDETSKDINATKMLREIINDTREKLREKIAREQDKALKDTFQKAESELALNESVYDQIEKYHGMVDSFDKMKIAACRIYYELEDSKKKATVTVDVVQFDDAAKSKSHHKGEGE